MTQQQSVVSGCILPAHDHNSGDCVIDCGGSTYAEVNGVALPIKNLTLEWTPFDQHKPSKPTILDPGASFESKGDLFLPKAPESSYAEFEAFVTSQLLKAYAQAAESVSQSIFGGKGMSVELAPSPPPPLAAASPSHHGAYTALSPFEKFRWDLTELAQGAGFGIESWSVSHESGTPSQITIRFRCNHGQTITCSISDETIDYPVTAAARMVDALRQECAGHSYFQIPPWMTGWTFGYAPQSEHPTITALAGIVPGLREATGFCPVEACGWHKQSLALTKLIIHLNDHHQWTREAIADWLDLLDIDLTIQAKEAA